MRFGDEMASLKLDDHNETTKLISSIWSHYDKDGNGYLSKPEARHFADKFLKNSKEQLTMNDSDFNEWFKILDSDGDGQISIVEMANYFKVLT